MAAKKKVEEAPVEETVVPEAEIAVKPELDEDTLAILAEAEALEEEMAAVDKAAAHRSMVILLSHFKLMRRNGRALQDVFAKLADTGLLQGASTIDTSTYEGISSMVEIISDTVESLVGPVKAKQIREDLEDDGVRLVKLFMEMLQLAEVEKA